MPSTIKMGLDSSDVDALIEKLERAMELAGKLVEMWGYFESRVQASDYRDADFPPTPWASTRVIHGHQFYAQCEAVHPYLGRCKLIRHDGDHYSATAAASALWRP